MEDPKRYTNGRIFLPRLAAQKATRSTNCQGILEHLAGYRCAGDHGYHTGAWQYRRPERNGEIWLSSGAASKVKLSLARQSSLARNLPGALAPA